MIDLKDYLSIGQRAVENKVIQHSDTPETYSSGLKNLLATPRLLHMAIEAAIHAIDIHLPQDYVSVGTHISFTHTAPTSEGMHVAVSAIIEAIEGNEISLRLEARDDLGIIGHGTHKRCIAHRQSIESGAQRRLREFKK